jgi:hypothetical protein
MSLYDGKKHIYTIVIKLILSLYQGAYQNVIDKKKNSKKNFFLTTGVCHQ